MVLIHKAAEVLKSYGATEVYLFGSMATGTYNEHSDVDLAVAGLPPKNFISAMSGAGDVFKRELDLIDLDEKTLSTEYLKEHEELKRVL